MMNEFNVDVIADQGETIIAPKILVIDDEPNIRLLVSIFLGGEGFKILQASNGIEGLEVARKERPSLILLDLRMPKMSGFEVLKALRKDEATKKIRVIVVSGSAEVEGYETDENSDQPSADEYLIKPFDLEDLLDKVRSLIPNTGGSEQALA